MLVHIATPVTQRLRFLLPLSVLAVIASRYKNLEQTLDMISVYSSFRSLCSHRLVLSTALQISDSLDMQGPLRGLLQHMEASFRNSVGFFEVSRTPHRSIVIDMYIRFVESSTSTLSYRCFAFITEVISNTFPFRSIARFYR